MVSMPLIHPFPTHGPIANAGGSRPFVPFDPGADARPAPMRVLVVDDEKPIREVLRLCLVNDGHSVGLAEDGVSGLGRFVAESWDLVLLDRAMPRMDGAELARAIKDRHPHMPVVLVTGFPELLEVPAGEPFPIDAIVRKPFNLTRLREGMARALAVCAA